MPVQTYLSIKEIAEQLGVEYKTIYRLIRRGEMAAAKIGGVYRLRQSDVDAFVEEQVAVTRRKAEAMAEPTRCERCLRLIRSDSELGGICHLDSCESVICLTCWTGSHLYCRHHQPTLAERLADAREARSAGAIPVLVTAIEARRRELNFRNRFDRKIRAQRELPHPAESSLIRIRNWDDLHTFSDEADKVAELISSPQLDPAIFHRSPINIRSRYITPRGRAQRGLVIEGRTLSHLSTHVNAEFDTIPATAEEAIRILLEYTSEAEESGRFFVVGIASTTGWDDEAVNVIQGSDRGEAWAHRLIKPYLIDLEDRSTITSRTDTSSGFYKRLFSLPLPEEEVLEATEFIKEAVRQQSSLSAHEVQEALDVSSSAVLTAFQKMETEGDYFVENVEGIRVIAAF